MLINKKKIEMVINLNDEFEPFKYYHNRIDRQFKDLWYEPFDV